MYNRFLGRLAILFALFCIQMDTVKSGNVVFCYWGTWANYRTGNGQFQVSNIDPTLCTHIGYAFFGLGDDNRIKSLDTWLDYDLGNIAKTVALKQRNPSLKVMASIGGWNEGSAKYSAMAGDAGRRAIFISSVVQFVRQNGFDGFDLDWEYPAQRGGSAADKANFVTLLRELNTALKAYGLLLTVAVAAGQESASISYDIPNFSKYVDLINVMTYDFAGSWDSTAGFNAPLQGSGTKNVKAAISYWLQKGAPAQKLVLGFPLYGRSFTLSNSAQNNPGAPVSGPGSAGPYTQEAGYLGYNEICEKLKAGWTRRWDANQLVPYAFQGNQWVGYDDKDSFAKKIDYVKSLNLAGGMVWSIETDDFRGICGEVFPLLKALKNGLSGSGTNQTPAVNPPAPVPKPPPAPTPASNTGNCGRDGFFVNPSNCGRFYRCSAGQRYDFDCPAGLYFDQSQSVCNWPQLVNCRP